MTASPFVIATPNGPSGGRREPSWPRSSLIASLIRPRPGPFVAHHLGQVPEIRDVLNLQRTVRCRLGKRVGDRSRSRPARGRPSDEVSDNRHRQRWTPADIHGRSAAGHARCGAGSPRRNLASGRRGQQSSSRCSPQHALCLVQRGLAVRLACPLRCRITPYQIKAAPLRFAAPGTARGGLRPLGGRPATADRACRHRSTDRLGSSAALSSRPAMSRLPGQSEPRRRPARPGRRWDQMRRLTIFQLPAPTRRSAPW